MNLQIPARVSNSHIKFCDTAALILLLIEAT